MNQALCNSCSKVAPAESVERDGKIYLRKECPDCGRTETLVSASAERYDNKRGIDTEREAQSCALNCLSCKHRVVPKIVFLDITNRCNMNCPICINNTPSMGFLFEPGMDYFEKVFSHFAQFTPKPAIQLFGGEPTVREDLFEIISLAKKYGLRPRVVTNGLKLADEDFCRKLVETNVKILLAYDGDNPELYKKLRGSDKSLALKHKALENVRKIGRGRVTLMTLLSKDYNAKELPDFIRFCHERRDFIGSIFLMPLAHTWDSDNWDYEPEEMTTEDVEMIVSDAFPDDAIEFLPAGLQGHMPSLQRCLRIKPLPFMGAHPNCESIYLMFSDGKEYLPFTRHFTGSPMDAVHALIEADKGLTRRLKALDEGMRGRLLEKLNLKKAVLYVMGLRTVASALRKHVRLSSYLEGRGIGKFYHGMMFMLKAAFGGKTKNAIERHTTVKAVLEIMVLPFESKKNIATDRMERCPAAFAYVDPDDDQVRSIPLCAWVTTYKKVMMKKIAEKYAAAPKEKVASAE